MEKKTTFFDKTTLIISVTCITIITIVGMVFLNLESVNDSTIIKSDDSTEIQEKIDVIVENDATKSNSYNPEIYGLININTADKSDLLLLDGIGERKAEDIISYRTLHPFKKIEDILNVSGIGKDTFEKIKDSICVN